MTEETEAQDFAALWERLACVRHTQGGLEGVRDVLDDEAEGLVAEMEARFPKEFWAACRSAISPQEELYARANADSICNTLAPAATAALDSLIAARFTRRM